MGSEPKLGVVVIGRNEGDRLKASLASLRHAAALVYVDSGSQDGSLEYAVSLRFDAISLTADRAFTAARARNEGIGHLLAAHKSIEFIQTVDGDCTIARGWLETAEATLRDNPSVATVFGRLRELNPDASIYNRICDEEWNVPVGEAESCGGIAMYRATALLEAKGFCEELIAGEEPDLCLRLKRVGWSILRADAEMGEHDAAIFWFGQWWRRSVRAGYAYSEHLWLHGSRSLPSWKRRTLRFMFWGFALPILALGLALILPIMDASWAWALLPWLAYPLQFIRIWMKARQQGSFATRLAGLAVIGKFAEALGGLKFAATRLLRRRAKIIEYK